MRGIIRRTTGKKKHLPLYLQDPATHAPQLPVPAKFFLSDESISINWPYEKAQLCLLSLLKTLEGEGGGGVVVVCNKVVALGPRRLQSRPSTREGSC